MNKCKLTILKTTFDEELVNGANMNNSWYFGDWINEEHKDVAICSCNDGLRPVIIKIERTDEVSE